MNQISTRTLAVSLACLGGALAADCRADGVSAPAAHARVPVRTGVLLESTTVEEGVKTAVEGGFGDYLTLFAPCEPGKPRHVWTPEKIRIVGEACRKNALKFALDELFDRQTGDIHVNYKPIKDEVLKALNEYRDGWEISWLFCETGGVLMYWPESSVAGAATVMPEADRYSVSYSNMMAIARRNLQAAERAGLPRPCGTVESSFGFASACARAGFDRVDYEMVYAPDTERGYAALRTAVEVFGLKGFGVDMAVCWYGGKYRDDIWESRWRTSLYHAYLRGASPIYLEHGLVDYKFHGNDCGRDHPDVVKLRRILQDFARWARAHPRAKGLPQAAVGAIQGRYDGYIGTWQTHLWGQRRNERFRIGDADTAWTIFDGLYRRRDWQDRERCGAFETSGNPPLGSADVLPWDAPDAAFAKYKVLFFLGRNVMDDALYAKLVRFVRGGGTLILNATHLDTADAPGLPFAPYRGGDWSELVGATASGVPRRVPYGTKFVRNPTPAWRLESFTGVWDPDFVEGGFSVVPFRNGAAQTLAVASDRFLDTGFPGDRTPVAVTHALGKGLVICVGAVDAPGARGVRGLYSFLIDKALEAADIWPKVECSDTVRWAVYPDGTLYFLNTEPNLRQDVILRRSATAAPERFTLEAGAFAEK